MVNKSDIWSRSLSPISHSPLSLKILWYILQLVIFRIILQSFFYYIKRHPIIIVYSINICASIYQYFYHLQVEQKFACYYQWCWAIRFVHWIHMILSKAFYYISQDLSVDFYNIFIIFHFGFLALEHKHMQEPIKCLMIQWHV